MHSLLVVVLLIAAPAALAPRSAHAAFADPEKRISLDVKEVPLRTVLERLATDHGIRYEIAPDVPDLPISLSVRDKPVREVIWAAAVRETRSRYMGIGVRRQDGVYQIRVNPLEEQEHQLVLPRPPDPRMPRPITLKLERTPLRQALASLFEGLEGGYVVDGAVPDVRIDLSVEQVPAFQALLRLAEAARGQAPDLEFRRGYGVYMFSLRHRPGRPAPADPLQRKMTVHFESVPILPAMHSLMWGSGLQYAVSPVAERIRVSFDGPEITLKEGLEKLLRSARLRLASLQLTRESDVYLVKPGEADAAP